MTATEEYAEIEDLLARMEEEATVPPSSLTRAERFRLGLRAVLQASDYHMYRDGRNVIVWKVGTAQEYTIRDGCCSCKCFEHKQACKHSIIAKSLPRRIQPL